MFVFGLVVGLIAGGSAVHYWPVVKAWFSDESAAIASAVKARI